jgi:hypothetical protein
MALWAGAFLGTTPIGGPIIGFVGEHAGPRIGLAVGGVAALLAGLLGWWSLVRRAPVLADAPLDLDAPDPERSPTLVGTGAPASSR